MQWYNNSVNFKTSRLENNTSQLPQRKLGIQEAVGAFLFLSLEGVAGVLPPILTGRCQTQLLAKRNTADCLENSATKLIVKARLTRYALFEILLSF